MATPIPLDEDTDRWLQQLSADAGVEPAQLVAALLRDIRIDDERAHGRETETLH